MYISMPVIIILALIIIWMGVALRSRKQRVQLLLWDIRELEGLFRLDILLPIYQKLENEFLNANDLSQVDSPRSYKRIMERLKRYDNHYSRRDFPVLADEQKDYIFWASEEISHIHGSIDELGLKALIKELEDIVKKTKKKQYQDWYTSSLDD